MKRELFTLLIAITTSLLTSCFALTFSNTLSNSEASLPPLLRTRDNLSSLRLERRGQRLSKTARQQQKQQEQAQSQPQQRPTVPKSRPMLPRSTEARRNTVESASDDPSRSGLTPGTGPSSKVSTPKDKPASSRAASLHGWRSGPNQPKPESSQKLDYPSLLASHRTPAVEARRKHAKAEVDASIARSRYCETAKECVETERRHQRTWKPSNVDTEAYEQRARHAMLNDVYDKAIASKDKHVQSLRAAQAAALEADKPIRYQRNMIKSLTATQAATALRAEHMYRAQNLRSQMTQVETQHLALWKGIDHPDTASARANARIAQYDMTWSRERYKREGKAYGVALRLQGPDSDSSGGES